MKRNLALRIEALLKTFPIVAIIGARQVGKTTLAKMLRPKWYYVDMQVPSMREQILYDPEIFFRDNPDSVILDEAQTYPILFEVLRGVIDAKRQIKGRFIITGSSSPELLKHLSESLAGRIAIVELGTLKTNEIAEKPLSSFYQWFQEDLAQINLSNLTIETPQLKQEIIESSWLYGGYPDVVLATTARDKNDWFTFYEKTYLYRDIASLFPAINQNSFARFFQSLAYLSGTIINKAELARDLEISQGSIHNYLKIAAGTFLWQNLNSFEKSSYKSLIKMPKGYFSDSGLLHYLIKIANLTTLKEHPLRGRSFEGFVVGEILKGLQTQSIGRLEAYHYRTRNGAEIDLLLEGSFGIVPIEIKAGIRVDKKQLVTLNHFIATNHLKFGIIINQAEKIAWLNSQIIQIPVTYI